MYKKVIVALSLEHGISDLALTVARSLVSEDGAITAAHVYEPPNSSILVYLDEEVVEKSQQRAKDKLGDRVKDEPDITSVLLEGQSAGYTITEYANTHDADCIVIGSHRPGVKDFFLGSTAARVVRHAHCSVHVLRV
ncbi:universal stress protein [Roseibium sp. MMSF_3544]|uniref:universal stress protein n=1 Tax=unclassified Roseibium TaxID=2629323 RepID=UPI00273D3F4F|nr:universal stress protein [Roseibium sp. MMSF_3544]